MIELKQRIIDTMQWCEQRKRDKPWYTGEDSPKMMMDGEFLKEICELLVQNNVDIADNVKLIEQCVMAISNKDGSIFGDAKMLVTCNFTISKCKQALQVV